MLNFIFTKNAMKLKINIGQIIERKTEVAFCHPTQLMLESDTLSLLLNEARDERESGRKKCKNHRTSGIHFGASVISFFIKQI